MPRRRVPAGLPPLPGAPSTSTGCLAIWLLLAMLCVRLPLLVSPPLRLVQRGIIEWLVLAVSVSPWRLVSGTAPRLAGVRPSPGMVADGDGLADGLCRSWLVAGSAAATDAIDVIDAVGDRSARCRPLPLPSLPPRPALAIFCGVDVEFDTKERSPWE